VKLMRGRKPKPTLLKTLEGNPGKRPINEREPVPPDDLPDCPDYLNAVARAEWFHTAGVLQQMGLLSTADRTALAAYCVAFSRWLEAEELVKKYGTIVKSPTKGFPMKSPYLTVADQAMESMRKFMVEFGLTPSSRSRIKVPENARTADEFDVFLEAG
jgi:P27 family predicted phage terminase small subunit